MIKSGPDDTLDALADEFLKSAEGNRGSLRSDHGVLTMEAEAHVRRREVSLDRWQEFSNPA